LGAGFAAPARTGGLAGLIGPYSTAIQHHEPWLTLDGLRIIFGLNEH